MTNIKRTTLAHPYLNVSKISLLLMSKVTRSVCKLYLKVLFSGLYKIIVNLMVKLNLKRQIPAAFFGEVLSLQTEN